MDDEEAIKKKIMQQRMQQSLQNQMEQQLQMHELETALKTITMQVLDAKGRERLANLKVVKPELATQLELYLAQLYQSGQLRARITDEQLVMILKKLTEKKETRITRK